ncbi:Arylsulfatase A [Cyclobacterium lianum]|uniref:Arylsulfatase A n=1 Tax=Cyclobacterium lianum TaxID=388280 RepID=A0A1M7LN53_9BACT|nr:arylsulfatase [Cyclobacterium lianum]SHM79670.1 Arylsulfatase A [Cyclobacterium lianum]
MIFLKFLFFHIFPMLVASLFASERGFDKKPNLPVKPNILFILPDDLGWADVGYHGSEIKTPNIDRLARSGKILSQHYVMPTCTPTRVSLMTGKYPSRYGVLAPAYGEVIDLGDPTIASLLAENGYYTAIAGKWHMGSPPYTPLKYGFQSSYGYFDGQIDPYTHEYKTETEQTERRSWHRNDEYLEEGGSHVTDLITAEAIRIIEEERDQPFFLYVAHHVPHYPLSEPEKYHSIYKDELMMHHSRRLFAASVSHLDESIGQIIAALERTGKRKNTLIVFVSDNGGQQSWQSETEYEGRYADKPHVVLGNNYPLRGWKGSLHEGGIRVPGFVNWPGHLEPGIVDHPIHISDWLPTLYRFTGNGNKPGTKLDGVDVWPQISANQTPEKPKAMYWKIRNTQAVRKGDWKLLLHSNGDAELYHLKPDFRETRNLKERHPEKVEELVALIEQFQAGDRLAER